MKSNEPEATPNDMDWIKKLAQRYRELYPDKDFSDIDATALRHKKSTSHDMRNKK